MINKLWVEKFRPQKVEDYVFSDETQKSKVLEWIEQGTFPHLLLSGDPGVGKTTLARVLMNELGILEYDILEINASRDNGVNIVRDKINSFVQTMPFGSFKVVLLDEADYTSPEFQAALRNDMESYSQTVRFILTCNYPYKIIPAIRQSRCHQMHIAKPDKTEFTARAATVLLSENIEFDIDTLDSYVAGTYPDLRKCLNDLQSNVSKNKLLPIEKNSKAENSLLIEATQLFKAGNIVEGRQQLMQYISIYPTRVEDIYVWAYSNLELWGKSNEKKDQAIVIIRNGLASLPLVGIPEIAMAATLVELVSL